MKSSRVLSGAALALLSLCIFPGLLLVGCYDGVGRSESVDVLQTEYSTHKRVAMVVERSDHAALSATTLFVFLDDHAYPLNELRQHLWGLDPVFRTGSTGITIHWSGPDELTVQCNQCQDTSDIVQERKASDNGVTIRYVGFP